MSDKGYENHYRMLENMYHTAPCNVYYSPTLYIKEGYAELSINIKEKFYHAGNAVHGSVYFKMIDDACYFAANSLERRIFLLTSNLNVYITRPVYSGTMKAFGKVVHRGRSQYIAEAILYDSENREIARGTALLVKKNISLNELNGYKLIK